ncbi:DUF2782 domain-containing protein [Thiorhodovibrio winogradskyi]|nr:DUF2782 domain-containing protein [Thiorhodovibrio winogradskyi]
MTPVQALARALMMALALLGFATNAPAQAPMDNPIYLPTPDLPAAPGTYPGDGIEPEVTITETESEVITEYRIRGKLYMVKIDPLAGPPYYLFDTDGDGQLDSEENRNGPNLSVPQWLLFSW